MCKLRVEELFQATRTQTFIPVLGASGSGKSSVVLAGLVPRLEQEGNWKFAHFRPGDEPFHALAKALLPLYELELNPIEQLKQSRQLAEYLIEGSVRLKDVLAQIESNHPNKRLLLIADQFEELYTLSPDETIQHSFLDLLLSCFQSTPSNLQQPPVLVTTMRADFLGNALAYRPLADVLNADVQLVGAMNREELAQVIVNPAAMLGVEFEPGLVDRILDDVEDQPGNLALLEFALTELWNEQADNQLTHQAYEKIGKVEGALAKYAEQKYQELDAQEKEQARQIFIQLVRLGEDNNNTRRLVNRNQIAEENWDLVARKHGLADSRLVVTSRDPNEQETLEVVHEALIRHWQRLPQWLSESREQLQKQRKLEDEAKQWSDSEQNTDYLLQKKRLREAKEFQQEQHKKYPLSELAASFIATSSKYQRRERIKALSLFLIIPLIGTVVFGYFLFRQRNLSRDIKLIDSCVGEESCTGRIQALKRLVEAEKSLQNYDLSGAELSGATLNDANLSGVKLSGANLSGANLIEVQNLFSQQIKSTCFWGSSNLQR